MAELKHCPFCLRKAKLGYYHDRITGDTWYSVRCSNPNCIGFYIDPQYENKTTAIGKWNRRAEDGNL